MKRLRKTPEKEEIDPRFVKVINAFSVYPEVTHGGGKGFGSGALKVNGSIFAMISSKGEFVVKLSKKRVDELVSAGRGERFDAGRGRPMKEWIAFSSERASWIELAREAYHL